MANPIEYIVFEPDQVLTNDHLNETFNYLDQQNRWTRNKLIGIGIVCGLDITLRPGVIEVSKGCGVTSQGYLITQDLMPYTYYTTYTPADVPEDLPFEYPYGPLPFYKPYCEGKTIYTLLTDAQFQLLEPAQQTAAKTLSSVLDGFLNDYVVALFLEAKEIDLKNCDTQDCNNKGEKMSFQVRPLLLNINDIPVAQKPAAFTATKLSRLDRVSSVSSLSGVSSVDRLNVLGTRPTLVLNLSHQIFFKRYNVPYTDLNNSDDVINAFVNIVDDTTLAQVASAYNYCYQTYSSILKLSVNPFTDLFNTLKAYRDGVLQNNPVFIQYFYDFIDDLVKAYEEFSRKVNDVLSACCPDENLFPLHLILGSASQNTSAYIKDIYRTYFIYSPLFAKLGNESAEAVFLFNRMILLVQQFTTQAQSQFPLASFELLLRRFINIKITPSRYEHPFLSERAIPYYYNVNVPGNELYKSWNYFKTVHNKADTNLGFNSNQYTSNVAVTQPLLYDIEQYNFFRVEGHIGLNFQTVLTNLLNQRLSNNLPFDIVAISADLLSSTAPLPACNFQDLDTGYDLIVSEAACKIHTTFCFITKMPYTPPTRINTGIFVNEQFKDTGLTLIQRAKTAKATTASAATGATISSTAATGATIDLSNAVDFATFKLNNLAVLEPVLTLSTAYKKGDYMRKYCTPDANTIGSGYLNALSSTGVFTNPIQLDQGNPLTIAYFYLFAYVDAVESLMFTLQTNTLAKIDMTAFGTQYLGYLGATATAIGVLEAMTIQNANAANPAGTAASPFVTLAEDLGLDLLVGDLVILTSICIDERLQVLKDEYNRRLTQFQQQNSLINYYKNHTGLEHKAGVPKGGTLVLVYHTDTQTTTPTTPTVPPILTGPVLTNPPILTGPVLTTPPVVTGPVLTTPPVVTGPILTNPVETGPILNTPPVVTGPILTTPPVVTGPVLDTPPVLNTPPVATGPVLNNPVTTPVGAGPVLNNPVTTPVGAGPVLNNPVTTPIGATPVLNNPVTTPIGAGPVLNNPIRTSPVLSTITLKSHATAAQGVSETLGNTIVANPGLSNTITANPGLSNTIVANPTLSNATVASSGLALNTVLSKATYDASTISVLKTFVGTLQDSNQRQLLINILDSQPVLQVLPQYDINDGVIIADFYIPYLCCSDCPPVAYVIPEIKEHAFTVTGGGSYCVGGPGFHVGLSGSDNDVNYQLFNGPTAVNIDTVAGTGSALDFGIHTDAGIYTVSATSLTTGNTNKMAGSATITVNPLPAVFDVTGGGSFCDGSGGANIGLSNSETGVNYQLMSGTANVGSVVAGTGQAISFGLQASVGTYTVVAVSAAGGCTSNMNGNAVLTISPLPAVFVVTGGGGYCAGGTGVGIGLGGSEKEVSYQLMNGTTAVGDKVAGTGAALDFGLQTAAGTYTVVATNAIGCTSTMTESAKVTINPAPAAFRMTGGGSYCDGTQQEFNIGLDSSEKEVSYQLMNSGAKVGDAIAGTGEALSFGARTEGGTYTVIATNPQGGCSTTMTGSAVITVNPSPKPFDVSTKGPISPNGTTITVSNSEIGVTYTLMLADKKVADAPGTGKIIGYPTQIALGIYTVIGVNDKTGCTTTMNGNVTIQGG